MIDHRYHVEKQMEFVFCSRFQAMSTIFFLIGILCLLSTVPARPSPQIIYSAVIYNAQYSPIQCKVTWLKPSGDNLESDLFQIKSRRGYSIGENIFDMGSWEARAIINEIQCGDLVLTAPFKGVNEPSVNWIFVVRPNGIGSFNPKPDLS